jgi:hypothetical protein
MKDRFDLEQDIMTLSSYVEQIELIKATIDSGNVEVASQALGGLSVMLDLHRDKIFDTMCQVLHIDEYNY